MGSTSNRGFIEYKASLLENEDETGKKYILRPS